jgi:hypothetical protein
MTKKHKIMATYKIDQEKLGFKVDKEVEHKKRNVMI